MGRPRWRVRIGRNTYGPASGAARTPAHCGTRSGRPQGAASRSVTAGALAGMPCFRILAYRVGRWSPRRRAAACLFQRVDSSAARIACRSRASRFRVSRRRARAKLAPEAAAVEGAREHREESLGQEIGRRLEVVPGAGAERLEPLGPPAGFGDGHDREIGPATGEVGDEGRPLASPAPRLTRTASTSPLPITSSAWAAEPASRSSIGVSLEGLADTPHQRLVRIHEQDADLRHGRLYQSVTRPGDVGRRG